MKALYNLKTARNLMVSNQQTRRCCNNWTLILPQSRLMYSGTSRCHRFLQSDVNMLDFCKNWHVIYFENINISTRLCFYVTARICHFFNWIHSEFICICFSTVFAFFGACLFFCGQLFGLFFGHRSVIVDPGLASDYTPTQKFRWSVCIRCPRIFWNVRLTPFLVTNAHTMHPPAKTILWIVQPFVRRHLNEMPGPF